MKRGDVIARDSILDIGAIVLRNCSSPEKAKAFMETDFLQEHNCLPTWELKVDELNPTAQAVVLTQAVTEHEEATVNWVIDGGVAIQYKGGECRIFELADEPEWKVIVESVPSYQSSVENMSDEDLRKAIDDLRSRRTFITSKPKRVSTRVAVDKNDPLAVALASMPADKKEDLMRKLGMVD